MQATTLCKPVTQFGMHRTTTWKLSPFTLGGALKHKDFTGGEGVIKTGDVQIIVRKGIMHSRHATADEDVNLFQIWVFPKKINIEALQLAHVLM
ncbi:MAG: pirin family protein [Sphingobacteriales bacterium]|nr:pirin family protein [Sphingobacteriales bacterium]